MYEQADCKDQTFLKLEIKFGVQLKKEYILFYLQKFNLVKFNSISYLLRFVLIISCCCTRNWEIKIYYRFRILHFSDQKELRLSLFCKRSTAKHAPHKGVAILLPMWAMSWNLFHILVSLVNYRQISWKKSAEIWGKEIGHYCSMSTILHCPYALIGMLRFVPLK